MLSILRRMHLPKTPWPLHHSFRWSCFVHQPMVMLHSPRSIWGGITRRWCSMSFNYHVHDNLEVQYGAILMVQIIDVIFSHVAITSTGNHWVPRCMPATSWRCHWCSLAIPPSSFQQSPNSEACWSSYRSRMSYWPKWKPLPSWARSWSNTPAPGLYQAAATQHATHWLIDRCCRGKQKPTDADRMLGSHGHSFSYVGLLFPPYNNLILLCSMQKPNLRFLSEIASQRLRRPESGTRSSQSQTTHCTLCISNYPNRCSEGIRHRELLCGLHRKCWVPHLSHCELTWNQQWQAMTATALSCSQRILSPGHWTVLRHLNIPIGSDSRLKYPDLTSHAQKYQKFKRPRFHSRNFEHIRTWDMESLLIWRDNKTTSWQPTGKAKKNPFLKETHSVRHTCTTWTATVMESHIPFLQKQRRSVKYGC